MPLKYRANVCAVVRHRAHDGVLVCRRADRDLGAECWQFPQGGIDPGEAPEAALLRELEEEIGTRRVEVLARAPQPVRYEFPPDVLARLLERAPAKAGYVGQEQTWFLGRMLEGDETIRFDRGSGEFDAFRWVTPAEALAGIVPFKTEAYRRGLTALGLLHADPDAPPPV